MRDTVGVRVGVRVRVRVGINSEAQVIKREFSVTCRVRVRIIRLAPTRRPHLRM